MTERVGVLSLYSLMHNLVSTGERLQHFLKRAAVLFDRIFFDTFGLGPPGDMRDQLLLRVVEGDEAGSVEGSRSLRNMIMRPSDLTADEEQIARALHEPQHPRELRRAALSIVESLSDEVLAPLGRPGRGVDYKTRGALVYELLSDIALSERCKAWIPDAVGLLTPLHESVLAQLRRQPIGPMDSTLRLQEVDAADFASLSWREIGQLRSSRLVHDFRSELDRITDEGGDAAEELWRAMWRLVQERRPQPGRTVVKGALGALPVVGSALGLVATAADADNDREALHRYGWLYFVVEARSLGASS